MLQKGFIFLLPLILLIPHALKAEPKAIDLPPKIETRCGWIDNPTPANWDITDKDGRWLIGSQGGYQAKGNMPAFPEGKKYWIKTNVHYGYGCACIKVKVDKKEKIILEIFSGKPLPLQRCRTDKALPSRNP